MDVPAYEEQRLLEKEKAMQYEIRVRGHLGSEWSSWFGGLAITNLEQGEAVLAGQMPDQAALHGVLMQIRDLGLPLLSVNHITTAGAPTAGASGTPEGGLDDVLKHTSSGSPW